eukprot:scaffold768_cov166-Amphora_coffeaeformis.AAC.33
MRTRTGSTTCGCRVVGSGAMFVVTVTAIIGQGYKGWKFLVHVQAICKVLQIGEANFAIGRVARQEAIFDGFIGTKRHRPIAIANFGLDGGWQCHCLVGGVIAVTTTRKLGIALAIPVIPLGRGPSPFVWIPQQDATLRRTRRFVDTLHPRMAAAALYQKVGKIYVLVADPRIPYHDDPLMGQTFLHSGVSAFSMLPENLRSISGIRPWAPGGATHRRRAYTTGRGGLDH